MIIKAVKFRKNGFYGQPFAFGGEEGMDKFDLNIRYRGSLQNYLIDTGDEVILVTPACPPGRPRKSRTRPASLTPARTSAAIWRRSPRWAISRSR